MAPDLELVTIELARLCISPGSWAATFRHYEQLLNAGLEADEAERIVEDCRQALLAKDEQREMAA